MNRGVRPDFAAQVGEAELASSGRTGRDWFRERGKEMSDQGATHMRASRLPEDALLLLEGWRVAPEIEPEPAPLLGLRKEDSR